MTTTRVGTFRDVQLTDRVTRAVEKIGSRMGAALPSERRIARRVVTIRRPARELYDFWRDLSNLPSFSAHLQSVQMSGPATSSWTAKGPGGQSISWKAEIVEDRPGEMISWRSLPGADVESSGSVRFVPAPGDRGTEVTVEMSFMAPGGAVGVAVARILGEEPRRQISDDLRRFKQLMETGEIARSESSPSGVGLGQRPMRQPAQPASQPATPPAAPPAESDGSRERAQPEKGEEAKETEKTGRGARESQNGARQRGE